MGSNRTKIASLLTATLASDPAALTRITFQLTGSFLRGQATGRSPKLAFRWAESVAEKLLANWIHLAMFESIQGDSGQSLWLLLLAIKQQIFPPKYTQDVLALGEPMDADMETPVDTIISHFDDRVNYDAIHAACYAQV